MCWVFPARGQLCGELEGNSLSELPANFLGTQDRVGFDNHSHGHLQKILHLEPPLNELVLIVVQSVMARGFDPTHKVLIRTI